MTPEVRQIHELVGALSDCVWRTINQRQADPGFSALDYLLEHSEGEPRPMTEEGSAIWRELTSPHNYHALVSYVDYWKSIGVSDYATKLHSALLTEAQRRRQCDAASDQSHR